MLLVLRQWFLGPLLISLGRANLDPVLMCPMDLRPELFELVEDDGHALEQRFQGSLGAGVLRIGMPSNMIKNQRRVSEIEEVGTCIIALAHEIEALFYGKRIRDQHQKDRYFATGTRLTSR